MNKWLERALISAGAAVVSTTAIVTTAERPGKRKKRKKKKGEESRGKDGALVDDDVPRSIGAQAAHDYRVGHDGGITTREFFANVRDASRNAARRVSTVGGYLLGKPSPPPPDAEEGEGEAPPPRAARAGAKKKARKKVRRRVRRDATEAPRPAAGAAKKKKKATRQRAPARDERSDFEELRDEAVKRAASAAAKHAADKTGLGDAAEKLKESGAEVWKKAEQLGKAVKERVPDDLGERASTTLGTAGKGIARGARALSERLRAALSEEERSAEERGEDASTTDAPVTDVERPDESARATEDGAGDGERLGSAFKGFARWMEGPGAPRDDDERARGSGRVRRATTDDVVEARDASEPPGDVVAPRDPPQPPPDVVEAKDPPDGP